MGSKVRKFSLLFFVVLISANIVLFSSQRYSPPKAESKSYSVFHCPSHESKHGDGVSFVVYLLTGKEQENGSEKHCFCYSCCNSRATYALTTQTAVLSPDKYASYLAVFIEVVYTENLYKNLPSRSPPSLIS